MRHYKKVKASETPIRSNINILPNGDVFFLLPNQHGLQLNLLSCPAVF